MKTTRTDSASTYEYINDYMYFVIRPQGGSVELCSGVNISGFSALTKGRHGLSSNPAVRGLQLVGLDAKAMAQGRGAAIKTIRGRSCSAISVTTDDLWYSELMLIEDASEGFYEELLYFCSSSLIKKIIKACMFDDSLPQEPIMPEAMNNFIEGLCVKYGKTTNK